MKPRECPRGDGKPAPLFGMGDLDEPIVGVPSGAKVRVRLRDDEWAQAFVRTDEGITCYILCRHPDGHLCLDYPQSRNIRSAT